MKENIPTPFHQKTPEIKTEEEKRKEREIKLKEMANDFLFGHYDEPGEFLSRKERAELRNSKKPEDLDRLNRYEKSKFRSNFFQKAFLLLHMALDEKAIEVDKRQELVKKSHKLLKDFQSQKTEEGNPISPIFVKRMNYLLEKLLQ